MRGGDGLGLEKEWRECSESGPSSDKDRVVSVCVCGGGCSRAQRAKVRSSTG